MFTQSNESNVCNAGVSTVLLDSTHRRIEPSAHLNMGDDVMMSLEGTLAFNEREASYLPLIELNTSTV